MFWAAWVLLFALALPSQAQQAFYIYRNDGTIHTFFTADIDSMACSTLDVDSVVHADFVVQEVYTPDSVYRIPMESIDSVAFVTPDTKYCPGVKVLEGELKGYVVSRDSLTLLFCADTPVMFLPVVGDKLVSTVEDDVLGGAFVGRVESVVPRDGGIEVVCGPVDLMEVFEYYYGIARKEDDTEAAVRKRGISDEFYATGMRRFSPGKLSLDLFNNHDWNRVYKVSDNLTLVPDKAQATVSVTPVIDYSASLIVNKDYGVNVSVTAIGNYTMEELLALGGSAEYDKDIKLFEKAVPIPEALVDIDFEFGVFNRFSGQFCTEQLWTQEYRHVFHWEWSSKGHSSLKETNRWLPLSHTYEGRTALSGSLSAGAYGKVGLAFIATSSLDISEVGLKVEGGVSCEGSYVPYKSDFEQARTSTDLYGRIKDTEFSTYWFYGLKAEAQLFKWSVSHTVPNFNNFPLNRKERMASYRAVPLFAGTKLKWEGNDTYSASATASGMVQGRPRVGFALIHGEHEEDATYIYSQNGYQGTQADLSGTFPNKSRSDAYTLYPLVEYMGMELIAEPSAVDDCIPEVETLEAASVTEKSGTLRGRLSGVEEISGFRCGFFYSTDPVPAVGGREVVATVGADGNFSYPLSGLRIDTTYYYCAFVSVDGVYTYGAVRSFTTKDGDLTPGQAVDLGLSVKWAGWNVGASSPEEHGDYFAWGEVSTKANYDNNNSLTYGLSEADLRVKGIIDGAWNLTRAYDAASVNWGGSWRMPTWEEIKELVDECLWTWTTLNGVKGYKVEGLNGNSIFLPAAGRRIDSSLNDAGSNGFYGSSTVGPSYSDHHAYEFYFYGGDHYWYYFGRVRYYGQCVRPVSD